MRVFLVFILSILSACYFSSLFAITATAQGQTLDKILAVVNDDVITQSEFNKVLAEARGQMQAEHATPPNEKAFRKQVLNQLIDRKIELSLAKQAGITISQAEVDKVVASIAKQNNVSVADLYDHVTQSGMSKSKYLSELKEQLTLQKLTQQAVGGKLNVSEQEITDFLHSNAWHRDPSKEYHLEDVLVPLSDVPSAEEIITANNRARMIGAKLSQGQSLAAILQAGNMENPPLQGGDLGFRKLSDIPTLFAEQVMHMQPNQVVGPIQAPNGFHMIRLVASRAIAEKQLPPDRKEAENTLLQQKYELAAQTWVSKMRNQSFVQIYG